MYSGMKNEPVHEIYNNVVCATSKASNQTAHMRSLIRAFASHLNNVWVLIYWLNIILSFQVKRRLQRLVQVYTKSLVKCQIAGNLKFNDNFYSLRHHFSWKTYARKWVVILKVTESRLGQLWKMYLFSIVYHSSAAHMYCLFLLFPHFLYKKCSGILLSPPFIYLLNYWTLLSDLTIQDRRARAHLYCSPHPRGPPEGSSLCVDLQWWGIDRVILVFCLLFYSYASQVWFSCHSVNLLRHSFKLIPARSRNTNNCCDIEIGSRSLKPDKLYTLI